MKPVDAESFQRIKETKQEGQEKNDDFDMEIIK